MSVEQIWAITYWRYWNFGEVLFLLKKSPATCAVSKPLEISWVFVRFGLSIPAGAMCGGVAGATCRKFRWIFRCLVCVKLLEDVLTCISFLPLNPISSKGEPKSHEVCLLAAQLVVRLVVPVAFASTNTEPVAELVCTIFLQQNLVIISMQSQVQIKDGIVQVKVKVPFAAAELCITELWLDREKLEFLLAFVTRNAGPLRLTNLLKMAMEKRKAVDFRIRVWHVNLGLGSSVLFSPGAALSTKLAIQNKAAEAREKAGSMKWTQLFFAADKKHL